MIPYVKLSDSVSGPFQPGSTIGTYVAGQKLFNAKSKPTSMYGVLH